MNNEEFVMHVGQLFNKVMESESNDDYVINPAQMDKLTKVIKFFEGIANKDGGEVEIESFEPKEVSGGVSAYFKVFSVYGVSMEEFNEAMSYCSALSIDPTIDDRICISCTVPNVFIRKDKA